MISKEQVAASKIQSTVSQKAPRLDRFLQSLDLCTGDNLGQKSSIKQDEGICIYNGLSLRQPLNSAGRSLYPDISQYSSTAKFLRF